jgi:hypothetical protein
MGTCNSIKAEKFEFKAGNEVFKKVNVTVTPPGQMGTEEYHVDVIFEEARTDRETASYQYGEVLGYYFTNVTGDVVDGITAALAGYRKNSMEGMTVLSKEGIIEQALMAVKKAYEKAHPNTKIEVRIE